MSALLELRGLSACYGSVIALREVSLRVDEGEMVALIGANGAGKSTTLRTVSGLLEHSAGTIVFDGHDIGGLPTHERVRLGVAHVPEGRKIFPGMTVTENLEMGAYGRRANRAELATGVAEVFERLPRLAERRNQAGGTLSGGEQQMLAIGRALMARPRMLLLDEPSMGLAPKLVSGIFDILSDINRQGVAVLVVEQNAAAALARCARGYVLEVGRVVRQGRACDLAADDSVRASYLGTPVGEG